MAAMGERIGRRAVYQAAAEYLERGFRHDDSVLTPGRRIWASEVFEELYRDFVSKPDFSDSDFMEKLGRQLANSSDSAKQLMAELIGFHLLITDRISQGTKLKNVNDVLRLMREPVEIPPVLSEAFTGGIVNPGTHFNTGRYFLLEYLVEVGRKWKALPADVRAIALDDPWKFQDVLADINTDRTAGQRRALLHLFFPSQYESILSGKHIGSIIKCFSNQLSGTTDDPFKQLKEIRFGLSAKYGEGFNFYDPNIRALWEQGTDPWPEIIRWAALLADDDYLQKERTEKLAAVERVPALVQALEGGDWATEIKAIMARLYVHWKVNPEVAQWVDDNPKSAGEALRALLLNDDEPGMRVQAFSDHLKRVVKTPGNRVFLASSLLAGLKPGELPPYKFGPLQKIQSLLGRKASKGSEGERYSAALDLFDEFMTEAAERKLKLGDRLDAQILMWAIANAKEDDPLLAGWTEEDKRLFLAWRGGAEGSVEDVEVEEPAPPAFSGAKVPENKVDWMSWAARETRLPVPYLNELKSLLDDKGQIVLYGPSGTGKTYVAQALARALCGGDDSAAGLVQFHPSTTYEDFFEGIRPHTDQEGRLHYEVRPGQLVRFAEMAAKEPDKQFVLVIDELNRANLPKVLGELLFLLEYRDRDVLTLYRPETPFRLPKNLAFIATMNTVDRSVAVIDAAMRRRFHFVPFYPDREPVGDVLSKVCGENEMWVAELVEDVNAELVADLGGRDHQLGASHFIKADRTAAGMERVWRYTIEPLIEDEFFGQQDRVDKYRWQNVVRRHAFVLPQEVIDSQISTGAVDITAVIV